MEKEIKKTAVGINYFEVDLDEMLSKLKGFGICDSCSTSMTKGYLVPVLNYVQCEECFKKSVIQYKAYEEDKEYEEQQTNLYKKALEN